MPQSFVNLFLYYLRFWARIALFIHKPIVIGITGSVGKSSTRNAVYSILKDRFPTKIIAKGNSETGIPLGILGFAPENYSPFEWLKLFLLCPKGLMYLSKTKYLVVEMGVDDPNPPKNMGYLLTIVKPTISILLNIHAVHTMQFDKTVSPDIVGSERLEKIKQSIAYEKVRIVTDSGCRVGIYNADDTHISQVMQEKKPALQKLLTFGSNPSNAISYAGYEVSISGTSFTFSIKNSPLTISFKDQLLPEEYREVFAAALIVGLEVGITPEQMKTSLEQNFQLPAGRGSIFKGIHNSLIIDSSYNASRAAVLAFLKLLIKVKGARKTVFLFGDMRELGEETEIEHKKIAAEIDEVINYLYCVGPLTRRYVLPNVKKVAQVKWFENSVQAGEFLVENLPEDSILLVKGSQNTIFLEEAIKPVLVDINNVKKLCRQSEYWMKKKGLHT